MISFMEIPINALMLTDDPHLGRDPPPFISILPLEELLSTPENFWLEVLLSTPENLWLEDSMTCLLEALFWGGGFQLSYSPISAEGMYMVTGGLADSY